MTHDKPPRGTISLLSNAEKTDYYRKKDKQKLQRLEEENTSLKIREKEQHDMIKRLVKTNEDLSRENAQLKQTLEEGSRGQHPHDSPGNI